MERDFSKLWLKFSLLLTIALLALPFVETSLGYVANAADTPATPTKAEKPEEDDFTSTPFTEYGSFNEAEDEEAETRYFQHGRFFGVSLGMGFEAVDGNRGLLWQGGFPVVDFKLHYWFDFNIALDFGVTVAPHYYNTNNALGGHVQANLLRFGVDIKYYFDTKNLSAPISFANPYVTAGGGNFMKTQTYYSLNKSDTDNSLGLSLGFGLEFAIKPRKSYFEVEGKIHMVYFNDTSSTDFSPAIPNLSGNFYTLVTSLLFTW